MSRLTDLRTNIKAAIAATKQQRDAIDAEILALERSLAALGDGNLTTTERAVLEAKLTATKPSAATKMPRKTGKKWGPGKLSARIMLELAKRKNPVKVARIAAIVDSNPDTVSNVLSILTREGKAKRTKKGFYQKA